MAERGGDTTGRLQNEFLLKRGTVLIVWILCFFPGLLKADSTPVGVQTMASALSVLKAAPERQRLQDYIDFLEAVLLCRHYSAKLCQRKAEKFYTLYPRSYLIPYLESEVTRSMLMYMLSEGGSKETEYSVAVRRYLKHNPYDYDLLYLYARWLERRDPEKGERLLRFLFLNSEEYFLRLKDRFDAQSLTQQEILRLVKKLIKTQKYRDAEDILLQYIYSKKSRDIIPLYRALADVYYMMKKYPKAARYYYRSQSFYEAAISFLRAGRYREFEVLLKRLSPRKDAKTCKLLTLKAQKLRRQGHIDKALTILRRLYRRDYPCKEETLWLIAWIEYLDGNYLSASYNFRDLYFRYKKPRYLYWLMKALKARGIEVSGKELEGFYKYMREFYGNTNISIPLYISGLPPEKRKPLPYRVEALLRAGLKHFAIREILKGDYSDEQRCFGLKALGQWKEAIRCAEQQGLQEILYPLAYRKSIMRAAESTGLDPYLLLSVMRQESMFQYDAVSVAGAKGLMQLMPFTAKDIARRVGLSIKERDLFHSDTNIMLGAHYLKHLIQEFGDVAKALAAYNAGEGRVRRWLKYPYRGIDEFIEDIPFTETRRYVKKVLSTYFTYKYLYSTDTFKGGRPLHHRD